MDAWSDLRAAEAWWRSDAALRRWAAACPRWSFVSGVRFLRFAWRRRGRACGVVPPTAAAVWCLAAAKYGLALVWTLVGGVLGAAGAYGLGAPLGGALALGLGLAGALFYWWEARFLLAFPLLAAGHRDPVQRSRRLLRRRGRKALALRLSLHLAAYMLGRPWPYERLRRRWILGCLALLLLCERAERAESLPCA